MGGLVIQSEAKDLARSGKMLRCAKTTHGAVTRPEDLTPTLSARRREVLRWRQFGDV